VVQFDFHTGPSYQGLNTKNPTLTYRYSITGMKEIAVKRWALGKDLIGVRPTTSESRKERGKSF
jgi:hypothetical protein